MSGKYRLPFTVLLNVHCKLDLNNDSLPDLTFNYRGDGMVSWKSYEYTVSTEDNWEIIFINTHSKYNKVANQNDWLFRFPFTQPIIYIQNNVNHTSQTVHYIDTIICYLLLLSLLCNNSKIFFGVDFCSFCSFLRGIISSNET